jgi:hypothetical protein
MDIIGGAAKIKRFATYGAEIVYPFITVFTAIGVAKVAFGIPPEIAFVVILTVVLSIGGLAIKIGLFGKDQNIVWANTPMAKELCDRVEHIENILIKRQDDEKRKEKQTDTKT